jgi:hypothetical protein
VEHWFAKLAAVVDPFRHADFGSWFAFAAGLKPPVAGVLIAVGLLAALAGARHRIDHVTSPVAGLLFGAAVAPDLHALLNALTPISLKLVTMGLPIVLAVLCAVLPFVLVFVVLGTLGAAVGAALVSDKELWLGVAPGFLIVGAVAAIFSRYLATVITAALGGVLVTGGVLALLGNNAIGKLLASSPFIPIGLAAAIAIAGAALQFATYQDDGERAKKKTESREKKQLDKEAREREARFANYRR